jgi:uncharacterized membrane protein
MSATRLGHLLFAVCFAGLGVLSLLAGDFALVWQPVPTWVPWREPLAYASGAVLLACGLGMLLPRTSRLATLVLTADLLLWLLLLRIPPLVGEPGNESLWLGFGETLMLAAGGWLLVAAHRAPAAATTATSTAAAAATATAATATAKGVRPARLLFGAALLPVGLSHFVYVKGTAAMVPGWLPFHAGFAYLTGAAHVAAGLALLCAVLPRPAARLEATMISLFTLLVWVPAIVAAPATRLPWTACLISAALAAATWAVAGSLDEPRSTA